MHLAEKILLVQPLTFRGDYRGILDASRAADLLAGQPAAVWMLEEVIPFHYLPETVAPLYNAL